MDERLEKALEFANFSKTFSLKKETLKEKLESKLIYGYGGGIFKIDRSLITFVQMLIDKDRKTGIPLIDSNGTPILINDLEKFRDEIFDRYFSATASFLDDYEKMKKTRSVSKLVDYE